MLIVSHYWSLENHTNHLLLLMSISLHLFVQIPVTSSFMMSNHLLASLNNLVLLPLSFGSRYVEVEHHSTDNMLPTKENQLVYKIIELHQLTSSANNLTIEFMI